MSLDTKPSLAARFHSGIRILLARHDIYGLQSPFPRVKSARQG